MDDCFLSGALAGPLPPFPCAPPFARPLACLPFTCFPTAAHSRFDAQPFRVLLLRRLWLPLPPSARNCQWPPTRFQCMDLARPSAFDNRRLEIVADGLPLFHGAQSAVDTTMVSVLRRDGTPHPRCVTTDGAALETARRRKETTYPELSGQFGRTKLVVLAAEVAGRWSEECRSFLSQLAKAKVRGEVSHLRARARQAWCSRWGTMLACSAARAVALSLLGRRGGQGSDGLMSWRMPGTRLGERPYPCASLFLSYHPFLMSALSLSVPPKKKSRFFFPFPPQMFTLFRILCVFSLNFGCVLKAGP